MRVQDETSKNTESCNVKYSHHSSRELDTFLFFYATFASVVLLFKLKGKIKDNLFKFVFYVGLVMQVFIRCTFLTIPVFLDEKKFGEFYDTFPVSLWCSLCTIVLLQWIKASMPKFAPWLIFFILVNSLMYVTLFVLPALEALLSPGDILTLFTTLYCLIWLLHVFAFARCAIKTYPWRDNSEWTDRKKPILFGFLGLVLCLCVRASLLTYASVSYGSPFTLSGSSSEYGPQQIPEWLLFLYYGIGELVPSFLLILIQYKLPSNLFVRPYGELERLIEKMKSETIDYTADKLLCKICLEREINTAFLPCRHSATCEECSKIIKECPLCRQNISSSLLLYKA